MDPNKFDSVDEGEAWLISYADMMTLIACFFILMMVFANYDPPGFNEKAAKVAESFRKDKLKSSPVELKFIQEEMTMHEKVKDATKISLKDGELIVTFSGSALFSNEETRLRGDVLDTVDSMIEIIKSNNPNSRILVEGHADDILRKGSMYKNNWDISAARSANVVNRFQLFGFPASNLSALAKGESQPLVSSKDESGRVIEAKAKLNRRVVIRVLEPRTKEKIKLGLGVYFKDARENVDEDYTKSEQDDFIVE